MIRNKEQSRDICRNIQTDIRNIRKYLWYRIFRNTKHWPNGAASSGGRPIGGTAEGGTSVFFVSAHLSLYIMDIYDYSLFISNIFHIYRNQWSSFSQPANQPTSQPNQPTSQPTSQPTRQPATTANPAQTTVRGSVFLINKSCARGGPWRTRAAFQKACVFTRKKNLKWLEISHSKHVFLSSNFNFTSRKHWCGMRHLVICV